MLSRLGVRMSGSFFGELKRRNVVRVAIVYVIVGWVLMQIGDVMFPALRLPEWTTTMLVAFLILGFPISIVLAWAYEVTPVGIKRTEDVEPGESIAAATGQKINHLIIAVLSVAVVLLLGTMWLDTDSPITPVVFDAEKSIAVLPFENRSADEEDAEFFAAGMHDELLTLLSKLGDLKVISRTSVQRLDENLSIPEIGSLLGVATVLEGQVQRAGDRLRINVQLIRTSEEDHIWATTYDRELTASNIFDVQSNIARTIASELHVQLSASDNSLLDAVPTSNIEALQNYMLANQLVERANFESFEQAARYLTEAIELDPNYAEAWAAFAFAHNRMFQTGLIGLQEYVEAARPALARALEINSALPQAHAELAAIRWQSGNFDGAEESFKTALELGPGDSRSLYSYGNYLRTTGRLKEAIPVLEKAVEGNPLSVDTLFELGKVEMYSGMPEQFVARANKMLEIDPSSVHGYVAKLQAYQWMGRYDLMWPWYIKSMESDPEDYELWAHLGMYSSYLGATDWIDPYLDRALELGPNEPAVLMCHASVLALQGQHDAAAEIARSALESGLADRWRSGEVFLRIVRDAALRGGDIDEARSWYQDRHPELFLDTPQIRIGNINAAADLALLLQRAGEPAIANRIIDAGLAWMRKTQPEGVYGYVINIVYVELLALDGQVQAALDALQQAVDSGWTAHWPLAIDNETLGSLRDEPQFQQITAQLENEMATQLEAIRALPYMGELDLR
jgi:TolB-like protein/Tfp pilus assembly protein PilF